MKKVILAVLVFFGVSGIAMATHCNQQFVQRSVGYYNYPVVQQIVVPQRIVEYVEVPNLQIVQRQYVAPVQKQVVQKVVVQKQRANPVRNAVDNVRERLQDRQQLRQVQRQRQTVRQKQVVKEIRVENVAY